MPPQACKYRLKSDCDEEETLSDERYRKGDQAVQTESKKFEKNVNEKALLSRTLSFLGIQAGGYTHYGTTAEHLPAAKAMVCEACVDYTKKMVTNYAVLRLIHQQRGPRCSYEHSRSCEPRRQATH